MSSDLRGQKQLEKVQKKKNGATTIATKGDITSVWLWTNIKNRHAPHDTKRDGIENS